MEIYTDSIWEKFLGEKKIVKELNAIRPKGIMMEDALQWLENNSLNWKLHALYTHPDTACVGYHENYYTACMDTCEGVIAIHIAWAHARMGIPTLSVGCDCKSHWIALRNRLKDAGFVR